MFGLLNTSQIYGLEHDHHNANTTTSAANKQQKRSNSNCNHSKNNQKQQHRRSVSSVSDTLKENRFFASLSTKSPTNFIEKFLKSSELLNSYDTLKNYCNAQQQQQQQQHSNNSASNSTPTREADSSRLQSFNCLQGSYRSNADHEFYEAVSVNKQRQQLQQQQQTQCSSAAKGRRSQGAYSEMTIKCSKNLLAEPTPTQAPATLQNYQKLPDFAHELQQPSNSSNSNSATASSGASSGEFNSGDRLSSAASNLYKKLSFGSRSKQFDVRSSNQISGQSNDAASDNSSSSLATSINSSGAKTLASKTVDLQRTSSSSSGDGVVGTVIKSIMKTSNHAVDPKSTPPSAISTDRAQQRKLLQKISNYDQQNKCLQRELAKEKRRRTEELACVIKSLLCFESKLKTDMKAVNQRMQEKDVEICRLVRQNRALRKHLMQLQLAERESAHDEGVVEDGGEEDETEEKLLNERTRSDEKLKLYAIEDEGDDAKLLADCLVLEALQCINCRKQFYDIELKESWTQTSMKDGSRKKDDHTAEQGCSSSDDTTVSSSFYGARRSVRYTSKRTSGTFRDYMRSRSMNIDDAALDQNSEENTSTISREDSQTSSYEKINVYSRTIERMHGVKCDSERESEQSGLDIRTTAAVGARSASRLSSKSSGSSRSGRESGSGKSTAPQIEEDDGIFSPTQDDDDDFEEELPLKRSSGVVVVGDTARGVSRRSTEFSEASPKQLYETSTDDWYASASDQEEHGPAATKAYGQAAVNPVLECVNQILLQQSLEENMQESPKTPPSKERVQQQPQQQLTPKIPTPQLQAPATNLPRRSSLSDRRSSRSNSHSSDGQNSRNGTLTRKRVHFSTKNSMVHVPRNDDEDDDADTSMISSLQQQQQLYYPMNYCPPSPQQVAERERLDTLNYESIYSNEYEPIGSEHNSSNLYVDMEATSKQASTSPVTSIPADNKLTKLPPALPPKPANLLKFKKSLQQLDEVADEGGDCCDTASSVAATEPDYCSISEVNMSITSVQIVADVHKAPSPEFTHELELELERTLAVPVSASTNAIDNAATQKTEDIDDILADIPKLPNVAAIIVPKSPKQSSQGSDYLAMSAKRVQVPPPNLKLLSHVNRQLLNSSTGSKNPKGLDGTPLKLQLNVTNGGGQQQYKRKHLPNILAEINKRMSQPNSPTTPTKVSPTQTNRLKSTAGPTPAALLKQLEEVSSPSLPLQAEFDWYNLDAEYGRAPGPHSNVENLSGSKMLAEIHEDHESIDEYNLDEEFSLASEKADNDDEEQLYNGAAPEFAAKLEQKTILSAVNYALPLYCDNTPLLPELQATGIPANMAPPQAKAKKIKKNLANFEKFIEGSGLSTKPLPSRRKIYFAGPV